MVLKSAHTILFHTGIGLAGAAAFAIVPRPILGGRIGLGEYRTMASSFRAGMLAAGVAFGAIGGGAIGGGATGAQAAIITRSLEFTASGLLDSSNNPTAPTDPVIGAFTVTFDNSGDIGPTSAGLSLLNLNIALGYTFEFIYSQSLDRLALGARTSAISAHCNVASGFDTFCLLITNVSDPAAMAGATFFYASSTDPSPVWDTNGVRLRELPVPEPATLGLLGVGLGALRLVRRRRGAAAAR